QLEQILSAPDAELVTLKDTGAGGNGTMKVAVSRQRDRMLFVSGDLASPPAGKTYQLWALANDVARSLAVVEPADGDVVKELSGVGTASKVAISVEPDGGSKTPTDVVMIGDLPA
ncbi:anti-sigma factor, partial [Actinophytocola sp.]|uniref:anti-sigma factor n=1 Tax=Actinophytocola sp. TaxID=1872138 RepID=UPI0038998923